MHSIICEYTLGMDNPYNDRLLGISSYPRFIILYNDNDIIETRLGYSIRLNESLYGDIYSITVQDTYKRTLALHSMNIIKIYTSIQYPFMLYFYYKMIYFVLNVFS